MNKILKKIIINELLKIFEKRALLYFRQIGAKKNKNIIDIIMLLIYKV